MSSDSPAAVLYDAEGNPVSVIPVGADYGLVIADHEAQAWQGDVLRELRIIRSLLARIVESDEHDNEQEEGAF